MRSGAVLVILTLAFPRIGQAQTWERCVESTGHEEFNFQVESHVDYVIHLVVRDAVTGLEIPESEAYFDKDTNVSSGGDPSECDHYVHVGDHFGSNKHWPGDSLLIVELYATQAAQSSTEELFASFTFFGQCNNLSGSSFFCPYDNPPNPDGYFVIRHVDSDPTEDLELLVAPYAYVGQLEAAGTGIGDYFGDDNWMIPYNLDVVNETLGTSLNVDTGFFLTPQDGPPFTVTAEADFVLEATPDVGSWDGFYDWERQVRGWAPADRVLRFPEGRTLVVEGDLTAEDVTFTTAGPVIDGVASDSWEGIAVYDGGSLDLDGGKIEYAVTGLSVYADDVTVTNSTVRRNGTGIESNFVQNYCPGSQVCLSGGPSSFTLEGVSVTENAGIGVLARNTEDVVITDFDGAETEIRDNGGDGLYLWNAQLAEFRFTHVEDNGGIGANVLDNADLRFTDVFEQTQPGLDRVANNTSHELFVSDGGHLFLGAGTAGGDNDVYDEATLGPSNRLLYNEEPCVGMICAERTIDAELTWWGLASGPPAGAFTGSVDYTPYRTSPATSAPRLPSPLVTIAGEGEAAGRGSDWLRETIREARRDLEAAPGAEGAASLVRRLYGLQRLDAADALGEHGPTMALLAVLRARLGEGQLPAPVRAAAEAALVAEVHDALRLGDYAEARGLLASFAGEAEGAQARRSLALARVMAAEQAGRYAEALAVLDGVLAEMEAEDPMRRSLAVVAEALAEQAGSEGRLGGSEPATASSVVGLDLAASDVLGAPYPNPSHGAAVVPLVLAEASDVEVSVYDVLGRRVAVLAEGRYEAGSHRLAVDASSLPAGMYVIRAAVDGARVSTQRLTVLR